MSSQHIRLASLVDGNPVTFTNFFQDPIVLPPHSRVALKQVKINTSDIASQTGVVDGDYLTWELSGVNGGKSACRTVYPGSDPGQDDNNSIALLSMLIADVTEEAQLIEESNPLNFIPLHNTHTLTLNSIGITIRDDEGVALMYDAEAEDYSECQYVYLIFDVECPKFSMRDLANLLQPKEDIVVAEQTEITKDILGK